MNKEQVWRCRCGLPRPVSIPNCSRCGEVLHLKEMEKKILKLSKED